MFPQNPAELLQRLRRCFTRREPASQAGKYIDGLIADLPRKNGWTRAEHAGDHSPDRMQRLLHHAVWDHRQAQAVVRGFVTDHLGCADAVLVLDESGQEKTGIGTAGVKRQYVGCVGKITNAVNVVYATYASRRGHAIVASRLYLPNEWTDDAERRQQVGTAYRYLAEGIAVLSEQAADLHTALRQVADQGWSHVVVDGKLFTCDRLAEVTTSVKCKAIHTWYSGKHHRFAR